MAILPFSPASAPRRVAPAGGTPHGRAFPCPARLRNPFRFYLALILLIACPLSVLFGRRGTAPEVPPPARTVLLAAKDADGRTDTLFVIYAATDSLRVTALPRDLDIDGQGHKVNAVMKKHGPEALSGAVSRLLGHPIDRHVTLTMEAFPGFLDQLFPNGVKIRVPYRMEYTDHAQHLHYCIPEGDRTLKGRDMVCFLRDRSDHHGDLGRSARQLEAVRVMARQALSVGSILRLRGILDRFRRTFETDLTVGDMLDLVRIYRRSGGISAGRIPGRPVVRGGISFFEPDRVAARRAARFFRHGLAVPERLTVSVLNGTGRTGLARMAGRALTDNGLAVSYVGNAEDRGMGRTTLRYYPERMEPVARYAATALGVPGARLTPARVGDRGFPYLVVRVGRDYARSAGGPDARQE